MGSLRNSRGQGMVEYVILVALVGVATIGMVRLVQKAIKVNLANVVHTLEGGDAKKEEHEKITEDDIRKSDFSDFMNGSRSK